MKVLRPAFTLPLTVCALIAACVVSLLVPAPAFAQIVGIDPHYPDPSYSKSEALTAGTPVNPYFGTGPTTNLTPVRAIAINVTVAGNVVLQLTDGNNITLTLPVGYYILPLQVIQVVSAGTTATATYADLG